MARHAIGSATYEAPPNIALVKYWGVRNVPLVLPNNSSISVSLDRLRSRTTVVFDPALRDDRLILNGRPASGRPLEAIGPVLDAVRVRSGLSARARVRSSNNFPTASGLASSASGFAALAGAASHAAGLELSDRELSMLARRGSGSASRSIFGGFVEWRAGRRADGADSYALPLHPPEHWPDLVDRVAIVGGARVKTMRSAVAMQTTVATSPEYPRRLAAIPQRISRMRRAIGDRDAEALFELTMEECDSFRLVCETSRPSLDYLTASSRGLIEAVRSLNRSEGRSVAGYTHDAGAHVHVFTLRADLPRLRQSLARVGGVARWLTLRPGPGGRLVRARPVGASVSAR